MFSFRQDAGNQRPRRVEPTRRRSVPIISLSTRASLAAANAAKDAGERVWNCSNNQSTLIYSNLISRRFNHPKT